VRRRVGTMAFAARGLRGLDAVVLFAGGFGSAARGMGRVYRARPASMCGS
jgi:hypothetical protein